MALIDAVRNHTAWAEIPPETAQPIGGVLMMAQTIRDLRQELDQVRVSAGDHFRRATAAEAKVRDLERSSEGFAGLGNSRDRSDLKEVLAKMEREMQNHLLALTVLGHESLGRAHQRDTQGLTDEISKICGTNSTSTRI